MEINTRFITALLVVLSVLIAVGCGSAQSEQDTEEPRPYEPTATEIADHYMAQAGMALSEDDKASALDYYIEAAAVYDKEGDVTVDRAEAHFLAADMAYQLMERDQAIKEYDAAVQIYIRFDGNSKIKAAVALNNMGTIYKEIQDKNKARNCWEKAAQIYKDAPADLKNPQNLQKIEQNIRDLDQGF
jgi:tetratricopeptide (TPR) repeat protein